MKRQIRCSVFETNSSSTHSIAIPKYSYVPEYVSFHIGEFGWEWDEANAEDYLYTAIYVTSDTEVEAEEKIAKLKNILTERGISYNFGRVATHVWHDPYDKSGNRDYFYLDNGYIDHGYELAGFVDELLNDGDKLVRFISEGLVFTGNDNSDYDGFVDRDQEFIEDYNWRTKKTTRRKNPYYMSDHEAYEWYRKGN